MLPLCQVGPVADGPVVGPGRGRDVAVEAEELAGVVGDLDLGQPAVVAAAGCVVLARDPAGLDEVDAPPLAGIGA